MNKERQPPQEQPEPVRIDLDAVCSECGALGAMNFQGVTLCLDCYSDKGSCCPEFGKDDLWQQRETS